MTITLATEKTYAVPGKVAINVTAGGSGNYARVWCSDAPEGSALRAELDQTAASRVLAYEGATGVGAWQTEMSHGGVYTFECQEYILGEEPYGGGYAGATGAWPSETKVGAETSESVYIGQRLTSRIGVPSYGTATLVVWVWNATIRATTIADHDEKTPAIVNPSNQRAKTAIAGTTTELAALIDVTAANAIGNLDTLCGEMQVDIPLHFNNSPTANYHNVVDSDNDTAIEQLPATPMTPAGFIHFAQVVRDRLSRHMANDSQDYHDPTGSLPVADYEHALLSTLPGGGDMTAAAIALADVYVAYNAHCADTAYHTSADSTNTLSTALGKAVDLHKQFVDTMRTLSPTAPSDVNPAVTALVHGAGFREEY
jgi:hypothetical protein